MIPRRTIELIHDLSQAISIEYCSESIDNCLVNRFVQCSFNYLTLNNTIYSALVK